MTNTILDAFRRRFVRNPEINELTPFGFYEAGWPARDTEDTSMIEVPTATLRRWVEALTLADSYMSLVYHRGAITKWGTVATPEEREWVHAMHLARETVNEARAILDRCS